SIEPESVLAQIVEDLSRLAEPPPLRIEFHFRGWHAHETPKLEAGHRAHASLASENIGRMPANLARFAAHIQLQTYIEGRRVKRSLGRESFRDLETVDSVYPCEGLSNRSRLVSLQSSDEMPCELAACERSDFGQAFLQEVLAEIL